MWRPFLEPVDNTYLGCYCAFLKQYYAGGSPTRLLYTESDDGITWSSPQEIATPAYDYNALIDPIETTMRTAGRTFYRHYQDLAASQGIHRKEVTLQKA